MVDFDSITRALSNSVELIEGEGSPNFPALENLTNAQEELKRAYVYSISRLNG